MPKPRPPAIGPDDVLQLKAHASLNPELHLTYWRVRDGFRLAGPYLDPECTVRLERRHTPTDAHGRD